MKNKMISLKKQTAIIIDGPMGSGKTTVANIIHRKIKKMVYLGTDKIKWLQSDFKRSDKEIFISIEVVLSMADTYLKNEMNILLAENIIDREVRNKFIDLFNKNKLQLFIYHLSAPKKTLLERLNKRGKEHEKKGIPPISKPFILRNLNSHHENREKNAKVLDSSEKTPEEIAGIILKEIRNN